MYYFTHSTPLYPGDYWRMTLNAPSIIGIIGFTTNLLPRTPTDINYEEDDPRNDFNINVMAKDASYAKDFLIGITMRIHMKADVKQSSTILLLDTPNFMRKLIKSIQRGGFNKR